MDTTYILEYLSLAQNCNFQESAVNLNMAQPTLSRHIKALESELGCTLFNRTTRSVELNECGKLFYEFALRYQAIYEDFIRDMKRTELQSGQKFSVAYDPILGSYQVIELLSEFAHQHPEIALDMIESRDSMELLKSHGCNYIVAAKPKVPCGDVEYTPYAIDRLAVILPADHPLAARDSVHIEQLQEEPFISYNDSFGEIKIFVELCREHGFEVNSNMVKAIFKSNAIKMVGMGLGVSVTGLRQIRNYEFFDTSHIRVAELIPSSKFEICFMRLRDHKRTAAEAAFLDYIQKFSEQQD